MSAAGRLWRRAPAWRLCLVTALAATALCALFPPARPTWTNIPGAKPAVLAVPPASHFVPQPPPIPNDEALVAMPPLTTQRSGNIPFGGHLLPLPAGNWQALVLARASRPVSAQVEAFARIEGGALTGLLLAIGSDPVANQPSPYNEPQLCSEADTIESWIAPESLSLDPRTQECWRLAAFNPQELAERGRIDGVLGRALARVQEIGVKLPDHLILLHYLRSQPESFLTVLMFLPEAHGSAVNRRWAAWTRRYVAALHDGFGGTLTQRMAEAEPR